MGDHYAKCWSCKAKFKRKRGGHESDCPACRNEARDRIDNLDAEVAAEQSKFDEFSRSVREDAGCPAGIYGGTGR